MRQTTNLEQLAGMVCSQTVDEVTQFVNTAFADVLQVFSQTELYSILNTWVLADRQASQHTSLIGI